MAHGPGPLHARVSVWCWSPLLAASLLCAGIAKGEVWGIGAAAGTRPVLSLTMSPTNSLAYHLTTHLSEDLVVLTADLQRGATPSFGYGHGWQLHFYGGIGAEGLSERDGEGDEAFRLRLPLGAQCNVQDAGLAIFIEAAGAVGPLPKTRLGAAALAGLRAVF